MSTFIFLILFGTQHSANLSCGIPPIPPIGCDKLVCLCDADNDNCQWVCISKDD